MSLEQTVMTSKTTQDAHVEGTRNNDVQQGDSSLKKGRDSNDHSEPKVYFERQTDCYCGLAALNNLYGYHAFTKSTLKQVEKLLHSSTVDLDVPYDFQEEERDFNIEVLMVAAKAHESENDGWLVLKHVGPSDRNAEFLMDKKKILVH